VQRIAAIVGRPDLVELGAREAPPDEPPRLVADVGRLHDDVGWRPARSLDDGLRDTVDWWRASA
jgi:nucleoside-diphosphate-sugar epimerase